MSYRTQRDAVRAPFLLKSLATLFFPQHPMTGITSVTLVYGSLLLLLVFAIKGHKKPRQEAIKKLPVMNG